MPDVATVIMIEQFLQLNGWNLSGIIILNR